MKTHLRALKLLARLLAADALAVVGGVGAYGLLSRAVLGDVGGVSAGRALSYGMMVGWLGAGLLLALALALYPRMVQLIAASESVAGEIVSAPPAAYDAVYAAPRRTTATVGLLSFGMLLYGYVPVGGPVLQERTLLANAGAVCAILAALVLYAGVRSALRPLVESLSLHPDVRDVPDVREARDEREARAAHRPWSGASPVGDRLATRVAAAIAVPASAAALTAALLVSAHVESVSNDETAAAREMYGQALSLETLPHEDPAGLSVAASALAGAHLRVEPQGAAFRLAPAQPGPPQPPFWSIPIALAVFLLSWQVGRRIGQSGSMDLDSASRRMAVVGAQEIRSVTMSMARPRSVPEIREMALALDTLAATLLRMAEDQQRALSARKEAARVRSFVLASVSHDLRGPLNSVLGFADLLLSGVEGPLTDGQRESLQALVKGGRDLLRLVGDLLDHARIDAGRMMPDRTRVMLDTVVERARVAAMERAKLPVDPDEIAIEGESGLSVVADEELVASALGALVAFALLRPGSNGRVRIRMRGEGEHVSVTVIGGGSTPTREALGKLFEPFDFAPTGARAPAGLNLAVSVARGIVALHGGVVTAAPHDEGGIALGVALTSAGRSGGAEA